MNCRKLLKATTLTLVIGSGLIGMLAGCKDDQPMELLIDWSISGPEGANYSIKGHPVVLPQR